MMLLRVIHVCPEGVEVAGVSWVSEEEDSKGTDRKGDQICLTLFSLSSLLGMVIRLIWTRSRICSQDTWKEDLDSGP